MSNKIRHKISLDNKSIKAKNYRTPPGAEGYNFDSGHLAFGTFEDWAIGKYRRLRKQEPNLF